MTATTRSRWLFGLVFSSGVLSASALAAGPAFLPQGKAQPNSLGNAGTYDTDVSATGNIPLSGTFYDSLGDNGRTCFSCHKPDQGWSLTPAGVQKLFDSSNGTDPLFSTNDGSNSPNDDVTSVAAKKKAFSLLLAKAVIRIEFGIPANAEFELTATDDPYHYATAKALSLYRRPLPSHGLKLESDFMWDSRETILGGDLETELENQANDATLSHANTTHALLSDERELIVGYESALFLAQLNTPKAGDLTAAGATGGPLALSNLPFYFGMNSFGKKDPQGVDYNPKAFTLFSAWEAIPSTDTFAAGRSAVARGEKLFNEKTFVIRGVNGFNDLLGQAAVTATCTACHNTPNVGGNSTAWSMNIGVADESQRTSDLPLYTLRNRTSGAVVKVSDPGRALQTGKWSDVGSFKVPSLRGMAARAPYFHNGSAETVAAVVAYHNQRFGIGLSPQESSDLVDFLSAL